jgi:hypothetical protein
MALHDTQTIVYAPIPASTEYWVRNVTNPNGEGDAGYATADQSYYGTGGQVKASAGDELEYIIVQSAGNTGDLNDVEIRSTMPLFTTYIGNSTYLNGEVQADVGDQSSLIDGLDAGTIVRHGQANVAFRVLVDAIPLSADGTENSINLAKTNTVPVAFTRLGRNVTVTSVDLNATGSNYAVVSPGANVTLAVEGNVQDTNSSCPGCVTQIYLRLSGVLNLCVSNSVDNSIFGVDAYYHSNSDAFDNGVAKTSKSASFVAPSAPGDYYINPGASWEYECQNSTTVADTFSSDTIATLRVE